MSGGLVIAVDGPAGSGKSTVAQAVATRLGLRYLDTGAMYRALTWSVLAAGLDPGDAAAVAAHAPGVALSISTAAAPATVRVGDTDVSAEIRGPAVTAAVSAVSAVPAVRTLLVARQREIIGAGGIVVEGRDIGTVVAPDAAVKVFLTASDDVRAARRAAQVRVGVGATLADLRRRDTLDSSRAASPLQVAADAHVLDSSTMGIEQVVDAVVGWAAAAAAAAARR